MHNDWQLFCKLCQLFKYTTIRITIQEGDLYKYFNKQKIRKPRAYLIKS